MIWCNGLRLQKWGNANSGYFVMLLPKSNRFWGGFKWWTKKIRAQVWSRWKMIHHFEKTKIDSRKCGMYLHSPPTTIYHAINSEQLPCSHSLTSPPPCFRVEVVCSGWCAPDKFQHTDSPTFPGLTCLDLCYALHIYRCWQRSVRYSKLKILIYRTAVHTGRLFIN